MKSQLATYLRSTKERAFMRAQIIEAFGSDLEQIVLHGQTTPMKELVEYLLAAAKGKGKNDKSRMMRDLVCGLGVLDSNLKRGSAIKGIKTMEAAASIVEAFSNGVEAIYPDIVRVEKTQEQKEADRLLKIQKAIELLNKELVDQEARILLGEEDDESIILLREAVLGLFPKEEVIA